MFRVFVDLDFLHALAGEELGKRKVSAEQQQKVRVMNRAIGSAIPEQAGHANRIGIVVFQPLLAAERIANGRLPRWAQDTTPISIQTIGFLQNDPECTQAFLANGQPCEGKPKVNRNRSPFSFPSRNVYLQGKMACPERFELPTLCFEGTGSTL